MAVKVAVLGTAGTVGREILSIMDERRFNAAEVHALGSRKSVGVEVSYGDRILKAKDAETFDWTSVQVCVMATGDAAARKWGAKISQAGCIVIDTSRAFRTDTQIPLVAPGINPQAIEGYQRRNIIACPDGLTTQLAAVLKPIHDAAGIERVVVATYQSVSDAGKSAMDELWTQTKNIYVNQPPEPKEFPRQIAFNVIPQIEDFMDDGFTEEEWRLSAEIRKLIDNDIQVVATCVRVPVFVGNGEAVHIELAETLSAADARALLRQSPGVMVVDKHEEEGGYVTPVESIGEWATFVSRVREDPTVENGLALWIVADNMRNGSALNAVQVAEILENRGAFSEALPG